MRRSNFFWGIVIVAIGAFLLLEPLGVVPEGTNIWKFIWPTALIALGIWFLLVPVLFKGQTLETETLSIPMEGAKKGRIRLKHGAGKLVVGASSTPDTLISGTFSGGIEHHLRRKDDGVKLKLRTHTHGYRFHSLGRFEGLNWDVNLTPDIPLRLDVNSGASETKLDLTDLKITVLNVDTGASSTTISLPAKAGLTDVRIDAGAASVTLRIPQDVAGRIRVESGLAGIHIDTKRFPKSAGIYISPSYDEADNKADIFIHTGVGSVDVR